MRAALTFNGLTLKITQLYSISFIGDYASYRLLFLFIISFKYLPVFSPNAQKYGPEKTPYLDTFHRRFVSLMNFTSNTFKFMKKEA